VALVVVARPALVAARRHRDTNPTRYPARVELRRLPQPDLAHELPPAQPQRERAENLGARCDLHPQPRRPRRRRLSLNIALVKPDFEQPPERLDHRLRLVVGAEADVDTAEHEQAVERRRHVMPRTLGDLLTDARVGAAEEAAKRDVVLSPQKLPRSRCELRGRGRERHRVGGIERGRRRRALVEE
jgi:hypothetical protein